MLSILSGTLSPVELDARLAEADAAVIMKVGRNLEKVRQAVIRAGLLDRAWYVERATMAGERVMPLDGVDPASAPYFSMVVIPSSLAPHPMSDAGRGRLAVVGLGPGERAWRTPEATTRVAEATDLVGYGPYLRQVGTMATTRWRTRFPTARRRRGRRSHSTLPLEAATWSSSRRATRASSPWRAQWWRSSTRRTDRADGPGLVSPSSPVSRRATAAAARIGVPLGHDLCLISLSDVLKPWPVIEQRITAAASADFVIALYNPLSRHRPWQLQRALDFIGRLSWRPRPRSSKHTMWDEPKSPSDA